MALEAERGRDDDAEAEADHRRRRHEVHVRPRARGVGEREGETEEQEEVGAGIADAHHLQEHAEADGEHDRSAEDAATAGDPAHARQSTRRAGVRAEATARPWPGGSAPSLAG